jgi:hypothetical protein
MERIFTIIYLFTFLAIGNAQEVNKKVGDKIYGDFNGDGKFEYAFRVLTKKGQGNPVEDGSPDEYELKFSDKNIKSIRDDFYWFTLINEGDLDNDGSDEISVREEPMNGCIGNVKTFTIKNGKSSYLFEPFSFYRGTCDNNMSINPQDLVENDNGIVYYYEYNADADLEPKGVYSLNGKGKKIFGKKIKAFELKNNKTKNVNDALKNILKNSKTNDDIKPIVSNKTDNTNNGTGKGSDSGYSLGGRKAIVKPVPNANCNEYGKVVVEIIVDKDGNVIKAIAGVKGSTNNSKCLLIASKETALKTKYEPLKTGDFNQKHEITYNYTFEK